MRRKEKGYSRIGLIFVALGVSFTAGALAASWMWVPDVSHLAVQNPNTTAYIRQYKRRALERGKKPVVMMTWVPLSDISPYLQKAVLVAEDDSFYKHGGVDWEALQKAIEYDREKGRLARGASTITQQVARNLYLSPRKSLLRKFKEILIARKLESTLSKDRILEIYLNIAEWGRGVYGAEAASQIYFGKAAKDLTPDEAAALAVALPSPWRRNPAKGGTQLEHKKETILQRMRKLGYLPSDVPAGDIEVPGAEPALTGAESPLSSNDGSPSTAPASSAAGSVPKSGAATAAPCDAPAAPLIQGGQAGASAEGGKAAGASAEPPDSCGPGAPSKSFFSR